jgi:hypothetical protein
LPVNWGNTFSFRNKDKAKRTAVKLNKYYTERLLHANLLYADVYASYRLYWLFLSPFDNRQLGQRFGYVAAALDHALEYQSEYYNTPADLNRVTADLNSCIDTLMVYAQKRKDIPLVHQLKTFKTRIEDEYNRQPGAYSEQNQPKRPALRKANGRV